MVGDSDDIPGRACMPGEDTVGPGARRRDLAQKSVDSGVSSAGMRGLDRVRAGGRGIDGALGDLPVITFLVRHQDAEIRLARMRGLDAGLACRCCVDVDASRDDVDVIGRCRTLRAFDALAVSGRAVAHGGLLGPRMARAEREHGDQSYRTDGCPRAHDARLERGEREPYRVS